MKKYISANGFYGYHDAKGNFVPVGFDIIVKNAYREIESQEITFVLTFKIGDKTQEFQTDFNELKRDLAKHGYPIPHSAEIHLLHYLHNQLDNILIQNTHKKIGWRLYNGHITHFGALLREPKWVQNNTSSMYSGDYDITPNGDKVDFIAEYNRVIKGNIPLEAAVIMGLSSSTIGYLRINRIIMENPIFDIYGQSSTGKTTAANLAVSMGCAVSPNGGKQSLGKSWDSTQNAIFGILSDNFGYTVSFDELKRLSKTAEISQIIYAMANSSSKNRLSKNTNLQKTKEWHTSILSIGEFSMLNNSDNDEGLFNRVITLGGVEWTQSHDQAVQVGNFVNQFSGLPMDLFVERLISLKPCRIIKAYENIRRIAIKRLCISQNYKDRVAKKVAVLVLMAMHASRALGVKIPYKNIGEFFIEHINKTMAVASWIRAYNELMSFVGSNGSKIFKDEEIVTSSTTYSGQYRSKSQTICTTTNTKGNYIGRIETKGNSQYLIIIYEVVKKNLKDNGYTSYRDVLKAWRNNGVLCAKSDRYAESQHITDNNVETLCCKIKILNSDDFNKFLSETGESSYDEAETDSDDPKTRNKDQEKIRRRLPDKKSKNKLIGD